MFERSFPWGLDCGWGYIWGYIIVIGMRTEARGKREEDFRI